MKRSLILIGMEWKYLLRQKFLWLLILIGAVFQFFFQVPQKVDLDYSIFDTYNRTHSMEGMDEREKFAISFCQESREQIRNKRETLYQRAVEEKRALQEQNGFEWEYLTAIEKAYKEEIPLNLQEYEGWRFFLYVKTEMDPHSTEWYLILLVTSAGLLLMAKDRENNTLCWSSFTGRGVKASVFLLKTGAIFLYGMCVHLFFTIYYVLLLAWRGGMDMRHMLSAVQNVVDFALCDLHMSILGVCVLAIVLKCLASLLVLFLILLSSFAIRRYLFLFLEGLCVSGLLYYLLYLAVRDKRYGLPYRMSPFAMLKMDRLLTYDAVNLFGHAVDVRLVYGVLWTLLFIGLFLLAYRAWRRFLYANKS